MEPLPASAADLPSTVCPRPTLCLVIWVSYSFSLKSVHPRQPLCPPSGQSLPRRVSFPSQYSLHLAQLHELLLLLQQLRQLGVALRHKVQDKFAAVAVEHPGSSSREPQGLQ